MIDAPAAAKRAETFDIGSGASRQRADADALSTPRRRWSCPEPVHGSLSPLSGRRVYLTEGEVVAVGLRVVFGGGS